MANDEFDGENDDDLDSGFDDESDAGILREFNEVFGNGSEGTRLPEEETWQVTRDLDDPEAFKPAHDLDDALSLTVDRHRHHEGWWRPLKESGASARRGV